MAVIGNGSDLPAGCESDNTRLRIPYAFNEHFMVEANPHGGLS